MEDKSKNQTAERKEESKPPLNRSHMAMTEPLTDGKLFFDSGKSRLITPGVCGGNNGHKGNG